MNQRFNVTRFVNKNGAISWRVDGRLGGLRIRRKFKARDEAAAERAALELKADQIESGFHSVMTSLSPEQLRDAEAASDRPSAVSSHCAPSRLCEDLERGASR